MTGHRCGTCKWWGLCLGQKTWAEEEQAKRTWGECRRHPPTALSMSGEFSGNGCWPKTRENEWCGEWNREREAAK